MARLLRNIALAAAFVAVLLLATAIVAPLVAPGAPYAFATAAWLVAPFALVVLMAVILAR